MIIFTRHCGNSYEPTKSQSSEPTGKALVAGWCYNLGSIPKSGTRTMAK